MADDQSFKGVLYTKIDLTSVGGNFLHLFNIHAQATYIEFTLRLYVETHVTRYCQLKEAMNFVCAKVFNNAKNFDKDKDLVMFVGDFNVNST